MRARGSNLGAERQSANVKRLSAAAKIARQAVGDVAMTPELQTHYVPNFLMQGEHLEGLPFGTRGGIRAGLRSRADAGISALPIRPAAARSRRLAPVCGAIRPLARDLVIPTTD